MGCLTSNCKARSLVFFGLLMGGVGCTDSSKDTSEAAPEEQACDDPSQTQVAIITEFRFVVI